MGGELVATHPGSPRSYRHPAYAYCRSTPAHNTVSIDLKSYKKKRGIAPGGELRTFADLPGAWYVSAEHEGYVPTASAVHARSILVIKGGPIWVRDIIRGGGGHTAYWSLHTPLDLQVQDDRVALLTGGKTYRLLPAFADQIASVKTEKRWAAVLPGDCQPADCGKDVAVLRYGKAIGQKGVQFCVAINEGDAKVDALSQRAFRLRTGERCYRVLYRPQHGANAGGNVECEGIISDAECTCVRYENGKPVRAWVIAGRRLDIRGTTWLDVKRPQTVELARPKELNGPAVSV
jgi:hypothetical protein